MNYQDFGKKLESILSKWETIRRNYRYLLLRGMETLLALVAIVFSAKGMENWLPENMFGRVVLSIALASGCIGMAVHLFTLAAENVQQKDLSKPIGVQLLLVVVLLGFNLSFTILGTRDREIREKSYLATYTTRANEIREAILQAKQRVLADKQPLVNKYDRRFESLKSRELQLSETQKIELATKERKRNESKAIFEKIGGVQPSAFPTTFGPTPDRQIQDWIAEMKKCQAELAPFDMEAPKADVSLPPFPLQARMNDLISVIFTHPDKAIFVALLQTALFELMALALVALQHLTPGTIAFVFVILPVARLRIYLIDVPLALYDAITMRYPIRIWYADSSRPTPAEPVFSPEVKASDIRDTKDEAASPVISASPLPVSPVSQWGKYATPLKRHRTLEGCIELRSWLEEKNVATWYLGSRPIQINLNKQGEIIYKNGTRLLENVRQETALPEGNFNQRFYADKARTLDSVQALQAQLGSRRQIQAVLSVLSEAATKKFFKRTADALKQYSVMTDPVTVKLLAKGFQPGTQLPLKWRYLLTRKNAPNQA